MKTSSKIAVTVVLLLAAMGAVAYALSGVLLPRTSKSVVDPTPAPAPTYSLDTRPTVEVYGDSITMGDSTGFSQTDVGPGSWVSYLGDEGFRFIGGFAKGGWTSALMKIEDQEARATFVVYAVGTNDLGSDPPIPFDEFAENAREFAGRQDARERFAVVAVGPMGGRERYPINLWNERLQALADAEGWIFLDPWVGMRDENNKFVSAYARDYLHPNAEGSKIYAKNVADQLRAAR